MESSINTNESSGEDIKEKYQVIKSGEKAEYKGKEESKGKREIEEEKEKQEKMEQDKDKKNDENEQKMNQDEKDEIKEEILEEKENKEEVIIYLNENINNQKSDNNAKEIINKEKENDKKVDINLIKKVKKDIKDESGENMNEIQYSHSLLEIVGKYDIQKMPDIYDKEDATFKVLFLGDSGVGKSSLVIRAIKKQFDSFYKPTVGFDLFNYIVKVNEKIMKLQIWDTCGQEEFSMINQSLFKNTSIAIMVYSIASMDSFENIKKWASKVEDLSKEDTIFFLVGNKSDLCNHRKVSFNEGKKYGHDKFQFFVETSSKQGYNVDILFKEIIIYLYEHFLINQSNEVKDDSKIEEYITYEQSSSFLSKESFNSHGSKKCLKCC